MALGLLTRLRAIPWVALFAAARFLYERGREFWGNLTDAERSDLGGLVRKSKGRRGNLTDREYERLKDLVKKGFTGGF
ncbi:MAG: hypothetical protein ACRDL3_00685 [Solirubrobacterales bacterium]